MKMINGVLFNKLPVINVPGGDVLHAIKTSDASFDGFGEAYFSTIQVGAIKGWKLHYDMLMNLVVPIGSIRFVIFDNRDESESKGEFNEFVLSRDDYARLTVPPNLWVAFQGLGVVDSILLNIANIQHDPDEIERKALEEIVYDWSSS